MIDIGLDELDIAERPEEDRWRIVFALLRSIDRKTESHASRIGSLEGTRTYVLGAAGLGSAFIVVLSGLAVAFF